MFSQMQKEYTWGGKLDGENKELKWNPIDEEMEEDEDFIYNHCLFLKQAVLGEEAKEGERNIIEVTTTNWVHKEIQQPILSLKLGLNECTQLDVTLIPPVTLRLKCGSGPVYLTGTHAMEMEEDVEYTLGDSSVEDISMSDLKSPGSVPRKRPHSARKSGEKKRPKVENGTDESNEDEDEESAEDEDSKEEEEEEEEDTEGDEDEDDEDGEDEEEESMEDDDESSPEKPKRKTKKGKQNTVENGDAKKKTKGKGKKMTVEEIKKEVTSKGSIKKEDKFNTMIKSKYNVNDAKKLQELWTWYKTK